MNELKVFNNPEFGEIRTLEINHEPYFVGKDVAEILGYSNTKDALASHVDSEDKEIIQRSENATFDIPSRGLTVINESGLYSLVLSSKLPTAKKFKRWVTAEVLPSIRKHGAYITPEKIEEVLLNPDTIINIATQLKAERQRRAALEQTVEIQRPKVLFADAVEASHNSILVGDLAKLLKQNGVDIGQNRLFDRLRRDGYLCGRSGDQYNAPTQRSMELGLLEVRERTINNPDGSVRITRTTKVTGKGQVYFINKYCGE